jgi:tetratricopeptide (TPR) repeat protein
VYGVLMTAMVAALGACQSEATFAIERRIPAPLALPEVRRVGVVAFVGTGGAQLAKVLAKRLTNDLTFQLLDVKEAVREFRGSPEAAIIEGEITTLDISGTLETRTLVTKRLPDGKPQELPTTRKVKTGKLQATWRVLVMDGRAKRGRAIVADVRSERIEDTNPSLTTLEPKDLPSQQDPIPTDDQVEARLIEEAAAAIARDLLPRREPAIVTWEDAGGVDASAKRAFAERDYRKAHDELRLLLNERALSVHERACVLYDAALCEDALGDYDLADRHLDEALALENNELHQAALRDLRRRAEQHQREERR